MTQTPEQKTSAAFFDLDLTLTDQDCFRLFLKTWYFGKVSRLLYLPILFYIVVLRKLRLISLKRFKEKSLIGLKGLSPDEIHEIGKNFFNHRVKQRLREQAINKINWHKKNGDLVFIVSGSPDIYVHAVCQYLGCDGYACTRLNFDHNRFKGRIDGPDCLGKEKQIQLFKIARQYRIDLGISVTYSDHESDLEFFETTGKKIAVTPTQKLKEIALIKNWEIVQW